MNAIEIFLEENKQLSELSFIITQFRNQCKPILELIISLGMTYSKTPKNIKEYISRSLIKNILKSIKTPYNSINHLLFLFEKSLKNPNDQIITLFYSLMNDISYYIKILVKYSMLIRENIEKKEKSNLKQYIYDLSNLYMNNVFNWYSKNLNTLLSLSKQENLYEFTDIDFNLIKEEFKQQIYLHQDNINTKIMKLISNDLSLKPYYSNIINLCNSLSLIDDLQIIKKTTKNITLQSNKFKGQYKISNNLPLTISHIPLLQIKVTMNYLPDYMSITSFIDIENFKGIIGNNFSIKCTTEQSLT